LCWNRTSNEALCTFSGAFGPEIAPNFAMASRLSISENIRLARIQLAVRVLEFYARLRKRAPTRTEVAGLKECLADDPLPEDASVDEMARTVIRRHLQIRVSKKFLSARLRTCQRAKLQSPPDWVC
jgi:hypothetical protein